PRPSVVQGDSLRHGPWLSCAGERSTTVVRSTVRRSPMRALMLIAATAMITSCSNPPVTPGAGAGAVELLAGRIAGPPQTCISTNPAENVHALDAQTLAYGYGRTI